MTDVYRALKNSADQYPDHWWHTKKEKAILQAAIHQPDNLADQVAAASLHGELLELDRAAAILEAFRKTDASDQDKAVAAYWQAHHLLAQSDLQIQQYKKAWDAVSDDRKKKLNEQRQALRKELIRLEGRLPKDLEEDRAVDLIASQIRLRQARGFYTGWQFPADVDKDFIAKSLDVWIKKSPDCNRIGQMYFLLGLAYADQGKMELADKTWKRHTELYPADRFAMLSRFHHTSYQFSPYGGGRGAKISVRRSTILPQEDVEKFLDRLQPINKRRAASDQATGNPGTPQRKK